MNSVWKVSEEEVASAIRYLDPDEEVSTVIHYLDPDSQDAAKGDEHYQVKVSVAILFIDVILCFAAVRYLPAILHLVN